MTAAHHGPFGIIVLFFLTEWTLVICAAISTRATIEAATQHAGRDHCHAIIPSDVPRESSPARTYYVDTGEADRISSLMGWSVWLVPGRPFAQAVPCFGVRCWCQM